MTQKHNNSPNRDPSSDDERNDAFVEQLLDEHFSVDPPDPQFVKQLSKRLDDEFEAIMMPGAADSGNAATIIGIENGALQRPDEDAVLTRPADRQVTNSGSHSRIASRWLGGAIAAAILLGMFTFWTIQPPTSWAEMIKALKSAPWIQTDSGRTSSWISASNQVLARREVGQTSFTSQQSGTHHYFVRDEARIYQTQSDQSWRPIDQQLIAWLAASVDTKNDSSVDWAIVSESAQYVDDADGRWLKLAIVFQSDGPETRTFTGIFTIDPESKMPVSCEVQEGAFDVADVNQPSRWQSVSFDYPVDGPTDIFDLGVATNTPIIELAADSRVGMVATDIQSAEDQLVLKDLTKIEPKPILKPAQTLADPEAEPVENKLASGADTKQSDVAVADAAGEQETISLQPPPAAVATTLPIVPIPSSPAAMTSRVDELVEELWTEKEIVPAVQADDETFLRRVYLDVIGRVPTIAEYNQFFELDSQIRRGELIDDLLESREHALHMGGIWKRVLVPDDETAISRLGGSGKLEQWLSDSFSKNLRYDDLVKQLLLAEGRVNESGPLLFYAAAKMNAEELAARTSRTFLGMRMECAECHDHPFDHWSQEDFWGLAAYFAQISRPQGKIEMVSPVLRVRDADFGNVKLPETETVIQPKLPVSLHGGHGMTEADIDELKAAEVTGGSRREQLAAWITHPKNSHFAQATANRIWAHLFGQGLVDPVDDMGGHNVAASPQLLNQLGRYFVQSGFDLRELMRVLLNSRAYQLASQNDRETSSRDIQFFARIPLKPLTAEQLFDSLSTATGRTDLGQRVNAPMQIGIASNVDRFSDPGRAAFLAQFRTSIDQRTDYQAGIPQALTLMNGPMIASATSDAPKGILKSLSAPFFDDRMRIEKLFIAALTRKPTEQERKRYGEFLREQPDKEKKRDLLGDVLWVLINSAEFTMNH